MCGEPLALSVTLTLAVLEPVDPGVNLTEITQLPPTSTDDPQVLVCAKSAAFVPVMPILVISSKPVPVFCKIVFMAELVTPTAVLGKVSEAGLKLTAAAVPVPLTGTLCGEPEALSVNTMAEDRAPVEDGVNTTDTVQVPPEGATDAHPVGVGTKSPELVPCETIDVMVSAALPELVTVKVCGAEVVPTVCELKVRLRGATPKLAVAVIAVPLMGTVCGEPAALSVTDMLAVRVPEVVGLKVIEIVQEPPAATLAPQVLTCK